MTWDQILEILAGIPRFPAPEAAQAAILKAMRREFPDVKQALQIAQSALETFPEWPGLPDVLALRNKLPEPRLMLPAGKPAKEPPLSAEERAWVDEMNAKLGITVKQLEMRTKAPPEKREPLPARGLRLRELTREEREEQNRKLAEMGKERGVA